MRPEDRERLFREAMEAYAAGDLDAVLSLHHPEVDVRAAQWMNVGIFHGREGFLEWARNWEEAWESLAWDVLSVEAVGERHIVAKVRISGKGRGSGIEIDHEAGWVVDVRDDLAIYLEVTLDEESARRIAEEREVSN